MELIKWEAYWLRAYMPPGPREGMLLGEPALFPFRHPLGWTPRVRVVDGDRLVGVVASVVQGACVL